MRYLDHIAHIDISHKAPHEHGERYKNLLYVRVVDENEQAPPPPQRPGYQDAKEAFVDMQKQSRQDLGIPFVPISERTRLHNQLARIGLIISQKNKAAIILFFQLGYQDHPGGSRLQELRTGISTVGKTVSGLKNGEIRQHRLAFSTKSIQASGSWSARLQTTSQKLSPSTRKPDRSLEFF